MPMIYYLNKPFVTGEINDVNDDDEDDVARFFSTKRFVSKLILNFEIFSFIGH